MLEAITPRAAVPEFLELQNKAGCMNVSECLGQLEQVRKSSAGRIARCPGPNHKHGDRKASLSVTQGSDGRILLYFHAGCDVKQICKAKGWEVSDLFPHGHNSELGSSAGSVSRNSSSPASDFCLTDADVDQTQSDLVSNRDVQDYIEWRGISLRVSADLIISALSWTAWSWLSYVQLSLQRIQRILPIRSRKIPLGPLLQHHFQQENRAGKSQAEISDSFEIYVRDFPIYAHADEGPRQHGRKG